MSNFLKFISLLLIIGSFPFPAAIAETGPEAQGVIGRWVRTDGGYALQIKEIGKDGTLSAAYFNPRPINVARAQLRRDNDTVRIVVELRDVNYPGSTYDLQYDRHTQRLIGSYFQAVEQKTFEVEFVKVE